MAYETLKEGLSNAGFTLPTPFTEDGTAVNHDALAANVEFLRDAGASLFVPCGNTGEYYSLSNDERAGVVRTVVDAVGDDAIVIGGVGGSTKNALSLLERYEAAGADGVLVMYPRHTYVHEDGIRSYYERIADATDLGVVLYKRGPRLSLANVAALSGRENVVCVKFAQNDVDLFAKAVSRTPGDVVWSTGVAERFVPAYALEGATGFTTGIGNFAPEPVLALADAVRAGDFDRAKRIRDGLRPYEDLRDESGVGSDFDAANNVPSVKYGQELAGLYGGPVREPLAELPDEVKTRCREYYDRLTDLDLD
ncbi:dihydrodipicolinate synthase family protein [Halomicrobium urmianum]|uniref:dihydrodipicolinate synthase family protein n=1 Tax=Halomicrobium urmianum TaxID=1586233 RepID=UPI001CD9232E|nr:dihydrodipicolinate synthase family protein [Halomicrobium urmianum]